MNMSICFCRWIVLGLVVSAAYGDDRGIRTFVDTFDGDLSQWAEVRGQWAIEDGVLVNHVDWDTARLTFPEEAIGDFRLDYQLSFDRADPALWAGILVGRGEGVWRITFRASGGVSWSFGVPGIPRGLFHDSIQTTFPPGEWTALSLEARADALHLHINGETVVLGPAAGQGSISLQARRHMRLDNVKLIYNTRKQDFRNRQVNGSFEFATNPDVPDYWALPTTWTRMNKGLPLDALPEGRMQVYREKWKLDDTHAVQGSRSLRVHHPLGAAGWPMPLPPGTNDYVVSAYLRSDRETVRVRLAADADNRNTPVAERVVEVGPDWRRASLLVPGYANSRLAVSVMPIEAGFVWIDAVQIETGREATAWTPSWYDSGFGLPHTADHVPPPASYADKTHVVTGDAGGLSIPHARLTVQDASAPTFSLTFDVVNAGAEPWDGLLTTSIEAELQEPTLDTRGMRIPPGGVETVTVGNIPLGVDRFRCRVIHAFSATNGISLRRERRFMDVPQPLRIDPEFSHYTDEKTARFFVEYGLPQSLLKDATLECELRLALQRSETYGRRTFPVQAGVIRQWIELPIRGNGWMHETPYEVVVNLLDREGRLLAHARCDLKTLPPADPDVRINHGNRGLYVNGEPYLPYGVYFTGALPDREQLQGYRALGFDFVGVLGHRTGVDAMKTFLADCEATGVFACVTQLSRKYGIAAPDMAGRLRDQPALILFNPVDETGQPNVYEHVEAAQHRLPHIPCFVNENTSGYLAFNRQLKGFPGPILSCDRYPLISQPLGWPQTRTDVNGIYSFEERIEWMDADGARDRKPLHYYLQAAEHTSREPTPAELTWMTYIPLVNRCLAFTYFDGIPHSEVALDAMIQLNREVQHLKPALFALEMDPEVKAGSLATERNVRWLAKQHDGKLTLVAVNRSLQPVDAVWSLDAAGIAGGTRVDVLFEDRTLRTDSTGRLSDRFEPLARHVYQIQQSETE